MTPRKFNPFTYGPNQEFDSLFRSSIKKAERIMSSEEIIYLARGLVSGSKGALTPPYQITVPKGTNLRESWGEENMSLEDRLKDIEDVEKVVIGNQSGVSIESIAPKSQP